MKPTALLRCPVCSDPLLLNNKQLQCMQGHSFDAARQGYWNLLLPQRKRSRMPGDNLEMVQARRAFLDRGFYHPLATALAQMLAESCAQRTPLSLLDLGCGEGYYTTQLHQALLEQDPQLTTYALDISKDAIRLACQRNREISWLVATGADIPLQANSVEVATLIFARLLPEATAKILKPGGYFLVVWAGPDHLRELRERIYDQVQDSDLNPDAQLNTLFTPCRAERLRFRFDISRAEDLEHLLMMTPHGQRLRAERRAALLAEPAMQLQADIWLSLYQKR
ncbi:putative RNA methyltransferase [Nitrincola tapanii]|uniref:Methyltransferase domain-containing protein n=1 Tax=Nitrincola tapanii TaxID=1708751 RepID=A0A5A9W1U9_9GAMM|nr:methyltransferase domain-containing protein [Nitrincola tapanii]KAA0874707.1 methyltransferase domain-containing protein [Nitrincola tapanii]